MLATSIRSHIRLILQFSARAVLEISRRCCINITMHVQIAHWRRRLTVMIGRRRWVPYVETATLALLILIMTMSYLVLVRGDPGQKLLTPPVVALMLIANLIPAIALLVFIGRRVAKNRAAASPIGGGGRLHVRLVGIFSLIASVPMLLVVVFSSILFQYGVQFWFSDQARGMLQNANSLAQGYYEEKRQNVANETTTMAGDLRTYLDETGSSTQSTAFAEGYALQVLGRNLSESAIIEISKSGPKTIAMVNPDARPVEKRVSAKILADLAAGKPVIVSDSADRIEAVTRLYPNKDLYLYASRISDRQAVMQTERAKNVLADYESLLDRSRRLQLQFNAALFVISLLIVGIAVWIALNVADRLVRPVGELVGASRRVAAGDLSARVTSPSSRDEVGTLAMAFNAMTRRLEGQTSALESRRALIEAVLTGVSAGVISVDTARTVRLMNASAQKLLATDGANPVGMALSALAPELDVALDRRDRETIIQLASGSEPRTLAVKIVSDERGHILTFDDITQQLLDQRRAAWSDVARRIAHEIKNPLTPIQLAAERLKRRYGAEIKSDPATFARLTDTIVRQVGDLRRMVDEFSSFARMPKPIFREEFLVDIARQALFLHEVAHPQIEFTLDTPEDAPLMICDRRQLGQALTNIVKNAVEAITQLPDGEKSTGTIAMAIRVSPDGPICIEVADSGVGLPIERERLVEPYVTTRARGTGLGLAIVKKIVEEHIGTMAFSDRMRGWTIVSLWFDPKLLAPLVNNEDEPTDEMIPADFARLGTN
jgi:two-component system, NtrC family, nitrogen regulation sensor histidine kinase NtrY